MLFFDQSATRMSHFATLFEARVLGTSKVSVPPDAAIAVVVGALFVRLAAKIPAKASALAHHLAYAFPAARCELVKATSGYSASFNAFETLAPALPEED